jgi:hypothetical protein
VVSVSSDKYNTIEYLPEGGYKNNEFCIWTLLPIDNTSSYSKIAVRVEGFGMEVNKDGVVLYFWDAATMQTVQTRKIIADDFGRTIEIDAPYAAVAFSSDSRNTGAGFRATIIGAGQSNMSYSNNAFVFNEPKASLFYPRDVGDYFYGNNERVSVVIRTSYSRPQDVIINYTDVNDDIITVYELHDYTATNQLRLIGRGTGYNPGGISSLSTYSYTPRLILFASNERNTGDGFKISWAVRF